MTESMARKQQDIDTDALVRLAATDSAALGLLYDIYYDQIFRYCICRLRFRQVAEDVTSNVFLSMAEGIKKFRGTTRGQFSAWLYSIATNTINQYLRDKTRKAKLMATVTEIHAARGTAGREDRELSWPLLHRGMLNLRPAEQTMLTLRYFQGFTSAKIAEMMDKNQNTVRVQLSRTLEKLKKILRDDFPEMKS